LIALNKINQYFEESPEQRDFIDNAIRYVLLGTALSCIIIVFLIFLFTITEAWPAIEEIGLDTMLLGTVWRPGSIIGTDEAQFGLLPMIVGSILSTFGAVVIGVPLSIGTAILLAEVAPRPVREIVRPAVELLAGIPSVVYGLFGMVVLAPLIRNIDVPHNSGFGLLNASIILAVMIIPTVTNIAEDAIRAVPREYKEGSLALGGTHWQTIVKVILPAARSGIIAAIILGIGRALGETMAMIMVIGNSIAMPKPLTENPLTLFLNTARTLTGNIAVEINYAAGSHRSALFFTGVLLFIMIMLVNSAARFLMRSKHEA
jgi:phosphate transport system permease protein